MCPRFIAGTQRCRRSLFTPNTTIADARAPCFDFEDRFIHVGYRTDVIGLSTTSIQAPGGASVDHDPRLSSLPVGFPSNHSYFIWTYRSQVSFSILLPANNFLAYLVVSGQVGGVADLIDAAVDHSIVHGVDTYDDSGIKLFHAVNNADVLSCLAIEKLWSVAKSYYVKRLLQNFQVEGCIKKPKFLEFVMESFAQIQMDKAHRLAGSNRAFLAQVL